MKGEKVISGINATHVLLGSIAGIIVLAASFLFWYKGTVLKDYIGENKINKVISYQLRDSVIKSKFYYKFDSLVLVLQERDKSVSSEVYSLRGSYNALDRSYVRTLEKWVKDKDELIKYKNEQIEELKKKDYLFWIPSDTAKLNMASQSKK